VAPDDERARLTKAANLFSEEDLTRFFQILLHTEEDLRRKPDPRLHLEMGLLRMVNAGRLAALEELIAELAGNASSRPARPNPQAAVATAPAGAASTSVPNPPLPKSAPQPLPTPSKRFEPPTPAAWPAEQQPSPKPSSPATVQAPAPQQSPSTAVPLDPAQVGAIKAQTFAHAQFLGELLENVTRWQLEGAELHLYFPAASRGLAELLQSRERMEKFRNIASGVIGQPVRVCVKLETVPAPAAPPCPEQDGRELRARFEQDPIVRAMLERFGGRISDVKGRGEE